MTTVTGKSGASILDLFSLAGKVAIITGASSGLGSGFAEAMASAGSDVVVCARRSERLRELKTSIEQSGRRCLAVSADVSDPDECERVVAEALDEFGHIDILVNNAGVGSAVPATRETPEQFKAVYEVNVFGAYWMAQACGRAMKDGSSIINISSVLGLTTAGLPQAAYCSSKAAVIGLTRDLAQQWTGRRGIRVNTLAPGYFPSEMTDEFPDGYLDQIMERVPVGRTGRSDELSAAVVYLASDASSYVTGALLPVDGGLLTN